MAILLFLNVLNNSESSDTRNHNSFSERGRVWSVNVCKVKRRTSKLEARLANAYVDILMLQKTWLCESVDEVRTSSVYLVGWLDRTVGTKSDFGCRAIYARNSVANIGLLSYSDTAERTCYILQTHLIAFLLGHWYRAPDTGGVSILSLSINLQKKIGPRRLWGLSSHPPWRVVAALQGKHCNRRTAVERFANRGLEAVGARPYSQ